MSRQCTRRPEEADPRQPRPRAHEPRHTARRGVTPRRRVVDEHERGRLVGIAACVHARQRRAKLVTGDDERSAFTCALEERVQLAGYTGSAILTVGRFAPAEAGAIVAAHARRHREIVLDPRPAH